MEKLILTCGRFVPTVGGDEAERIRGLEAYLVRLTEELELIISELGRTLDRMDTDTDTEEG